MEVYRYFLYLEKLNGYWEKEPYQTLEEIQPVIDSLDEDEYWCYVVKDIELEKTDGYGIICSGKVHTKQEYKTYKRKR